MRFACGVKRAEARQVGTGGSKWAELSLVYLLVLRHSASNLAWCSVNAGNKCVSKLALLGIGFLERANYDSFPAGISSIQHNDYLARLDAAKYGANDDVPQWNLLKSCRRRTYNFPIVSSLLKSFNLTGIN